MTYGRSFVYINLLLLHYDCCCRHKISNCVDILRNIPQMLETCVICGSDNIYNQSSQKHPSICFSSRQWWIWWSYCSQREYILTITQLAPLHNFSFFTNMKIEFETCSKQHFQLNISTLDGTFFCHCMWICSQCTSIDLGSSNQAPALPMHWITASSIISRHCSLFRCIDSILASHPHGWFHIGGRAQIT